ncbi:MAG: hypothetical protein J5588_05305 [Bacteroidales bacterium]|nr:hypothetical protein [Bacteroidales bacterium]
MKLFTSIFLSLLLPLAVAAQAPVVSYDSLVTPWSRTIVGLDERDSITTLDYFVLDSMENWLHRGHCTIFRDELHRIDSISFFKKQQQSSPYGIVQDGYWLSVAYTYKDNQSIGEKRIDTIYPDSSNKGWSTYPQRNFKAYRGNIKRKTDIFLSKKESKDVYDSIVYNPNGLISEIYENKRKTVYYYKNDTLLTKKQSYRLKNNDWKKGTRIKYYYDDGRLSMTKSTYDKTKYYYHDDGRLSMTKSTYGNTKYYYHDDGTIEEKQFYLWNAEEHRYLLNERRIYSPEGNLLKVYVIPDSFFGEFKRCRDGNKEYSYKDRYKIQTLKEEYVYDSSGAIIEERFYTNKFACVAKKTDYLIRKLTYEYDSLQQIRKKTEYSSSQSFSPCFASECCYNNIRLDTHWEINSKKTISEILYYETGYYLRCCESGYREVVNFPRCNNEYLFFDATFIPLKDKIVWYDSTGDGIECYCD